MEIKFETKRFFLRRITLEDVNDFFELDSDPEVHKYLGGKPVTEISQSETMVKDVLAQYERNGIGRLAVIDKNTGDFIGWSSLKLEDAIRDYNYYDIGYRLKQKYWGKE